MTLKLVTTTCEHSEHNTQVATNDLHSAHIMHAQRTHAHKIMALRMVATAALQLGETITCVHMALQYVQDHNVHTIHTVCSVHMLLGVCILYCEPL